MTVPAAAPITTPMINSREVANELLLAGSVEADVFAACSGDDDESAEEDDNDDCAAEASVLELVGAGCEVAVGEAEGAADLDVEDAVEIASISLCVSVPVLV